MYVDDINGPNSVDFLVIKEIIGCRDHNEKVMHILDKLAISILFYIIIIIRR